MMTLFHIRKRHARPLIVIMVVLMLAIGAGGYYAYTLYKRILSPNVRSDASVLYIYPGTTFPGLLDTLDKYQVLADASSFEWVAGQMDMPDTIRAGRYVSRGGMNNRQLVNLFRGGMQEAILLPLVKKRTLQDLADYLGSRMMTPAPDWMEAFTDDSLITSLGFTRQTLPALFLTDSYSMYWTTSPADFLKRMKREYDTYWNEDRLRLADSWNLTPLDVIILASIVEEETAKESEKPTVAGLYLNRLQRGMLLQADPTVKFAVGDFELRRILFEHLEVESPYNTYLHAGLPPGPICIPFKSTIEAVLSAEVHDYIFMCAKPDFSGYHNFARSAQQHARNRQAYIRALNERSIR